MPQTNHFFGRLMSAFPKRRRAAIDRVFLVHHFREFEDGHDDLKLIGVYSTEANARAAIERVKKWRAFRDDPKGFLMSVQSLDRESWYGEYDDV